MKEFIWIETILLIILGVVLLLHLKGWKEEFRILKREKIKVDDLFSLANLWIESGINRQFLAKTIERMSVKSVVVYGLGELGIRTIEEIMINSKVSILYGLDQHAKDKKLVVPTYTLEEAADKEKPDMVILTVINAGDGLKKGIEHTMGCKVYLLEELLNERTIN